MCKNLTISYNNLDAVMFDLGGVILLRNDLCKLLLLCFNQNCRDVACNVFFGACSNAICTSIVGTLHRTSSLDEDLKVIIAEL